MALVNLFDSLATAGKQDTTNSRLQSLMDYQLIRVKYDQIALSNYTTDNQAQTVQFKLGGVVKATLTIVYSGGAAGGNILTVTRS